LNILFRIRKPINEIHEGKENYFVIPHMKINNKAMNKHKNGEKITNIPIYIIK